MTIGNSLSRREPAGSVSRGVVDDSGADAAGARSGGSPKQLAVLLLVDGRSPWAAHGRRRARGRTPGKRSGPAGPASKRTAIASRKRETANRRSATGNKKRAIANRNARPAGRAIRRRPRGPGRRPLRPRRAKFSELAQTKGAQTDAALYWKAYAQNRLGKRDAALATIADLKRRFPQSRWQKDAECAGNRSAPATGQPPHPDSQSDDDLKMLAIQGLMNSDSGAGLAAARKNVERSRNAERKIESTVRDRAERFTRGATILVRVAKGQSNPELQRKAIEYLGIFGGVHGGVRGGVRGGVEGGVGDTKSAGGALQEIYASTAMHPSSALSYAAT